MPHGFGCSRRPSTLLERILAGKHSSTPLNPPLLAITGPGKQSVPLVVSSSAASGDMDYHVLPIEYTSEVTDVAVFVCSSFLDQIIAARAGLAVRGWSWPCSNTLNLEECNKDIPGNKVIHGTGSAKAEHLQHLDL